MDAVEYGLNLAPVDEWIEKNGRGARERLCGKIGTSMSWFNKIRSTQQLPAGRQLAALADELGVPVDTLVIRRPKKPRN